MYALIKHKFMYCSKKKEKKQKTFCKISIKFTNFFRTSDKSNKSRINNSYIRCVFISNFILLSFFNRMGDRKSSRREGGRVAAINTGLS